MIKKIVFAAALVSSWVVFAATPVATFKGFHSLSNGAYSATLGEGNSFNKITGAVTIGSAKPLDFTLNTTSTMQGLTVLVKYSSLQQVTGPAALITMKNTGSKKDNVVCESGVGAALSQMGYVQGVWQDALWNNASSIGSEAVSSAGYLILREDARDKSTTGTIVYDGNGNTIYNASGLRATGANVYVGDRVNVGGIYNGNLLATGMVVEGVRIYDGLMEQSEVASAIADYEAFVPTVTIDATESNVTINSSTETDTLAVGTFKNTRMNVVVLGGDNTGATIDLGDNNSKQMAHYIFESGTNNLSWRGTSENMNFTTDAKADDPSIMVKSGATLNFTARDITGWKGTAAAKAGNVIRVNDGGTMNVQQYVDGNKAYTHFFQGQYYLEPGATMNFSYNNGDFRMNGGANESHPQFYVPAATGDATTAVIKDLRNKDLGFRLASDTTAGIGAFVGAGSTLKISANVSSDGACAFAKWGAGTIWIDGSMQNYAGTFSVNAGTLSVNKGMSVGGTIAVKQGAALDIVSAGGTPQVGDVLVSGKVTGLDADNLSNITFNGAPITTFSIKVTDTAVTVGQDVARVNGKLYADIVEAVAAAGNGGTLTLLVPYETVEPQLEGKGISLVKVEGSENDYTVSYNMAEGAALIISEIMPKPTDEQSTGAGDLRERMDVNGLESGWVEVENTSDKWVDLKDYLFVRVNRSKKTSEGYGNFPSRMVAPHTKAVFYTSERYANSADPTVSAFATCEGEGAPRIYPELNDVLVWGDKVNPKKSPFVRLYYAPAGGAKTVVDTVVIPNDLPEGWSIIVGHADEAAATERWMCPSPTRGTANTDTANLPRIGPNVGPLYELSDQKKHSYANEFVSPVAPAVPGTDYNVELWVNPVMNPDGTFTPRAADAITAIKLVYRKDLDNATLTTNEVDMTTLVVDAKKGRGNIYTATIPASFLPEAGHLMQWKTILTDAAGNDWVSPSFNNKDDGYEWYGTIVEPGESLTSATLPTWHLFADAASKEQMDKDVDAQDKSKVPYNARVGIYDSSTSNYYDYVRIDLRGNTSANFTKKSHGFRFAKSHPMTMVDIVSGEKVEEIRKTSLISEFADPSRMRQMIAFWLWRKMGNKVPFDFPVRANLNGEFYQLGFNSERFTDELIEDVYGFDKYGYGYKNVGTLKSGSGTTAGGIEKKTPDDGNESDISVLQNELRSKITAAQQVSKDVTGQSTTGLDNAELTKFVVEKFDLPAWLNYLASARITQETDDVWANVSIYYDNPAMKEGTRGTGTWIPLGYDFNLSLGQFYQNDVSVGRAGIVADRDWFKSHPFYGGNRVRCWKQPAMTENCNSGNDGVESVWQNSKFRRLYLRRLRTLMDQELGQPDADETFETCAAPFIVKMREMLTLMRADGALDLTKWPDDGSDSSVDVWTGTGKRPANIEAGVREIYTDYLVPRRQHLFVSHSVNNTAKAVGYGTNLNAGIPDAQSAIASLKGGISARYDADIGAVVILNANAEAVDMSGWELTGPVNMTLPAGTVIDMQQGSTPGEVYVAVDRRATIAAIAGAEGVTDQVIVGNGEAGKAEDLVTLKTADGEDVYFAPIDFEWINGEQPKGWINSWNSYPTNKEYVVGADGVMSVGMVCSTGYTWSPYQNLTAKTKYTLSVYGAADLAVPVAGKYAILWDIGGSGQSRHILAVNDAGEVVFLRVQGATVQKTLNAGNVRGYHLISVVFDSASGAALYVDGDVVATDSELTTAPGSGFQVGSLYGGYNGINNFARGTGFVPLAMWGSDTASAKIVAALAERNPAVETIDANIEFDHAGARLYLPSLTNTDGNIFSVAAGVLTVPTNVVASVDTLSTGAGYSLDKQGELIIRSGQIVVDGEVYYNLHDALVSIKRDGAVLKLPNTITFEDGKFLDKDGAVIADAADYGLIIEENPEGEGYVVSRVFEAADDAGLMVSEICPKLSAWDEHHRESGWMEFVNTSKAWVKFGDYAVGRYNRGKAVKAKDWKNNVALDIAPGERLVIKTSEEYDNPDTKQIDCYPNHDNAIVFNTKINPKKYPLVILVKGQKVKQNCIVPVDLPEDMSVVFEANPNDAKGGASVSWICAASKGGATDFTGAVAVGPQISALYGVKDAEDYWTAFPMAKTNEDYAVTLPVNPVYGGNELNEIASVKLIYRIDFGDEVKIETPMTKSETADALNGWTYSGAIPASAFTKSGQMVRWAVEITDAAGNVWRAPSFHNPDDVYEYYGTITEPSEEQTAGGLNTLHQFVNPVNHLAQMDVDADKQDKTKVPYNARVAIYDGETGMFYDNVRIDLRGNTSGGFTKKSHGLKFNKSQPWSGTDAVTGEKISEARKTSFTAEYGDPSFIRQELSFLLQNRNGAPAPFHYPVRLNLNGEFYELGFHTERFTDELIEDFYGLDKYGYGYKNIGTFANYTTAASTYLQRKTPDDGTPEGQDGGILKGFCDSMSAADGIKENADFITNPTYSPALTKIVVNKFNLPAWINYLAISKITLETDDMWANLSGYYDINGTGTWMPLAYDMNTSFGQWYCNGDRTRGLISTNDTYKSHPFYGGWHIRAYNPGGGSALQRGNRAVEAIFQNEKFRRLFLRRFRTIMDAELCAPGTPKEKTPMYVEASNMVARLSAVAQLDRETWNNYQDTSGAGRPTAIWVWPYKQGGWTAEEGLEDIWENYIVPRREHLYVYHSVTNTERVVSYGADYNAGIPEAQSATADLKDGFSASYDAALGAVVITNENAETVDMSGWTLSGPVSMTIPAGTVIDMRVGDAPGVVYVAFDRKATIEAFNEITDQVVIGNGARNEETAPITLRDAEGVRVVGEPTDQEKYLRVWGFCGAPDGGDSDAGEFIILTNLNQEAALDISGALYWSIKSGSATEGTDAERCKIYMPAGTTIPAGGWLRLEQADYWTKITDGDLDIWLRDSYGSDIQKWAVLSQKKLGVKETGYFAKYDFETDEWTKDLISNAPGYVPPTTPITPSEGTLEATVTAADIDAATNKVVIIPPAALTDPAHAAAYPAYFIKSATDNQDGTWTVTLALDPELVMPVIARESESESPLLADVLSEIAALAEGTEKEVYIANIKPGLFYYLKQSRALEDIVDPAATETPLGMATSEEPMKATLTITGGGKAFYRVLVRPAATEPQSAE